MSDTLVDTLHKLSTTKITQKGSEGVTSTVDLHHAVASMQMAPQVISTPPEEEQELQAKMQQQEIKIKEL